MLDPPANERLPYNDELGIAEAIRDGNLPSPQKYENVTLFQIRITGTGLSYRTAHSEYVWRDSSLYLTDRFLQRCAGLTVTWEHPETGSLDSKEFGNRVIGSIMFAFIVGDDVHGIAKIYDETAAKTMTDKQLSTSPGVVLRDVDDKVNFDDGSVLLIEGEPRVLDHVAICERGVWDRGGPATGVINSTVRKDSIMTQNVETVEARADADTSVKLDKMMSYFDKFSSRLDAIEAESKARRDSDEKEKEERKDKARKDAKARRDAERAEWEKSDAAACAKDDAEEEEEKKKFCDAGDDEETAMDKARVARKDRMKARKDESEEEEKKEQEKEKDDAARKDKERTDAEMKALRERTDALLADKERSFAERLATMPKSPNDPDYGTMADAQAVADGAYRAFGKGAPPPMSGESILAYRRRLANGLKQHSPDWKSEDIHRLDGGVLAIAEKKIYADAEVASHSSEDIAEGIMIPRKRVTDSGHQVTEYRGRTTIFKQFSSPALYATKFLDGRGS